MSVEIDVTTTCDECGDRTILEGDNIYCEGCYDGLQRTIDELYSEIEGLEQEVLELTQENEDLRDNSEVTS